MFEALPLWGSLEMDIIIYIYINVCGTESREHLCFSWISKQGDTNKIKAIWLTLFKCNLFLNGFSHLKHKCELFFFFFWQTDSCYYSCGPEQCIRRPYGHLWGSPCYLAGCNETVAAPWRLIPQHLFTNFFRSFSNSSV